MTEGWEAGTFRGVEEAQAKAVEGTTPDARFRWLMHMLDLAAATGALARARADEQAWCDRVRRGETGPQP